MPARNTIEIIIKGEDKASGVLNKIGGGIKTLGKVAIVGLGAAAAAGGVAGAAMIKLAADAAPLENIEAAFERLAATSGKSANEMLAALEKGSAGMIAQRDLMKSYNLAVQLVGDQFANQLPNAMEYLSKVAAATGEDMGYMMDSLVRGVGRLSPLILDNLGIQVDLTAAYEAYAASVGKSVSELTKQEQQTALMNQVMEKLAENTADLPEVTGTAAAAMAQLRAQFQNLKDQVGKALLPVLLAILTPLADLATKYGPQLVAWAEMIGQWLGEKLPAAIETLTSILSGELPVAMSALGPVMAVIKSVADVVVNQAFPALQAAFASLTDALNTLGLDWSDVFQALLTATAIVIVSLIAILTGLITAIASLVEHVAGVMASMAETFRSGLEAISQIIGGAMAIWQGITTGNLDLILTGFRAFGSGLLGLLTTMFEGMVNLYNLTFGTIIAAVSGFISGVIAFFKNLKDALVGGSIVPEMMDSMVSIISSGLQSIIGLFADMASKVISTVKGLGDSLYSLGESIMESLKSGIMSKVASIIAAIQQAIRDIIGAAKGALDAFSPSRVFEDIGEGMMEGMARGISSTARMPAMAVAGAAAGTAWTVNNYFNMTVNTRATMPTVTQDFETMRALV